MSPAWICSRPAAGRAVKIAYFTHSLASCWNHGNAHFVRGVLRELLLRGHEVAAFEPAAAWSLTNLLQDHGEKGLASFRQAYPELRCRTYADVSAVVAMVDEFDLVIVHEWSGPDLVAALSAARKGGARYLLLFHDTHHRAVSTPADMRRYDLDGFDAVLAFGETLAAVYRGWGWADRVYVWHEAADTRLFHPPAAETTRHGLVWVGNWGDGERSAELESFLLRPARDAKLPLDIYGVRYPEAALDRLDAWGAHYRGWAPNARVPSIFASYLATIHVPRRFYVTTLPGIPTIRVFEALACGIPLISAPWDDCEGLFRVGQDFLMATSEDEMHRLLRAVRDDRDLQQSLVRNGLATIEARHTCRHRADELLTIVDRLRAVQSEEIGA